MNSPADPGDAATGRRLRAEHAESFIRDFNTHTGCRLAYLGMAELGETNAAAFVQWPNGRPGVLTRTVYPSDYLKRTAEILETARARGIPVPRYDRIVEMDGWTVVVQERLPGSPLAGRRPLTLPMVGAILDTTSLFDGLLADADDVPTIDLGFDGDDPRYALLDSYDSQTRALCSRIRDLRRPGSRPVTGSDLVHGDFSPPNILFDDADHLTGVVDWHDHTLYRGDRRYSLIVLRFEIAWGIAAGWTPVTPGALRRLDEALDAIEPATRQLYWTQPSLNLVGGMIAENRPADVDRLVAIALSGLAPAPRR